MWWTLVDAQQEINILNLRDCLSFSRLDPYLVAISVLGKPQVIM